MHQGGFIYKTKHFIVHCLKPFIHASTFKKDALLIDFNNCLQSVANPYRMLLTSRPIYYTHSFVLTPTGHRWSHSMKFNNSYWSPITSWGHPRNYTRNRTVVCGTHFTQSGDYVNWHVDGRHDIFLLLLLLSSALLSEWFRYFLHSRMFRREVMHRP